MPDLAPCSTSTCTSKKTRFTQGNTHGKRRPSTTQIRARRVRGTQTRPSNTHRATTQVAAVAWLCLIWAQSPNSGRHRGVLAGHLHRTVARAAPNCWQHAAIASHPLLVGNQVVVDHGSPRRALRRPRDRPRPAGRTELLQAAGRKEPAHPGSRASRGPSRQCAS